MGSLGNGAAIALDEPIVVQFDRAIDMRSVGAATARLAAVSGPGLGHQPRGRWSVRASTPSGVPDSLVFEPELPAPSTAPLHGGLWPATRYELVVDGGQAPGVLRFTDGTGLPSTLRLTVETRSGVAPSELFLSARVGGPRVTSVVATPLDDSGHLRLGRLGDLVELRVAFDQPLDPREYNVSAASSAAVPGRVQLRYDDPQFGAGTLVPLELELESNTVDGAVLVARPLGVLPSSATLRLTIDAELRDLFGEARGPGEPRLVAQIPSEPAWTPQWDALVVDFTRAEHLGVADFAEVPAVVQDGALRVPQAFDDPGPIGDWVAPRDAVLRTDSQTLSYVDAPPRTFTGGVLHVRNLHVPVGVVVHALGPNPLVLVVHGDARIDGVLSVRGKDADLYFTGNNRGPGDVVSGPAPAPRPTTGQPVLGGAGGGSGARHALAEWTLAGLELPGSGAPGAPHGGGGAGLLGCGDCRDGSGGGGGAMASRGDPWFPRPAGVGTAFVQPGGAGGFGCTGNSGTRTRTLPGGAAGQVVWRDHDEANDHWGRAYEPRTGRQIRGELSRPVGGGGGGAGGNRSWGTSCETRAWATSGGGGGGGGGVIVLQVRGRLHVARTGRIVADGGHGVMAARYVYPGGGGGGAGGMVVLMAGERIVLEVHGETFANADYDFPISADGGVCREPWYAGIRGKYPAPGTPLFTANQYDEHALGGFGGLGIVQLMVPVGADNADGTNTVLDDHIVLLRDGLPLGGMDKQRYLGWRGFPDEQGAWLDDFGQPTNTVGGMGDIRPAPVLLPAPFTTEGLARARSSWLPLGARVRRPLSAPDGDARGVVGDGLSFGSHARPDGWLPWSESVQFAHLQGPALWLRPEPVAAAVANVQRHGRTVHRVQLSVDALGVEPDRYAGWLCALRDASATQASLRVLAHDASTLWVAADEPLPTGVVAVQLHAMFTDLAAAGSSSHVGYGGAWYPDANARLGFAFHRDPANAAALGPDPHRFPPVPGTFVFDLADPLVGAQLRAFGATHLMWDVLLDETFELGGSAPTHAVPIALRRAYVPSRF